jgi:Cu2+-exporting ATPase
MQRIEFTVEGMVCVACHSTVKTALLNSVKTLPIEKPPVVTANFLENRAAICFDEAMDVDKSVIVDGAIRELAELDFTASEFTDETEKANELSLAKAKRRAFLKNLILGIIGTLVGAGLIAISLSGLALPLIALYALVGGGSLLTLILGAGAYRDAAKKLVKARTLTMDSLFVVSTLTIIAVSIASFFVPWLPMMLESGVLIFGFRHLGKAIEESLKSKVTKKVSYADSACKKVQRKIPNTDEWEVCLTKDIQVGDTIRVIEHDTIPVDGTCLMPSVDVGTECINGQTTPAQLSQGSAIYAGMTVPDGVSFIEIQVTKIAADSYLAEQEKQRHRYASEQAPIQHIADKIQNYFIPAMFVLAAVAGTLIGVFLNPALAIQCVTSLLVSACPCTLGFITPLAVKIGLEKAKQKEHGIHFRSAESMQSASNIDVVVFDLNGTLTMGAPEVVQHVLLDRSINEEMLFRIIHAMESQSTEENRPKHAVAAALERYAETQCNKTTAIQLEHKDVSHHAGMAATIQGEQYLIGNGTFLRDHGIPFEVIETAPTEQITYIVKNGLVVSYFKLKETLRPDAKFTIDELKRMGKEVHLCTGASAETAAAYARELGVALENIKANCDERTPENSKANYIQSLKQNGKRRVAMVGDAGNDGLAIARSDFGVAMKKSASLHPVVESAAGAVLHRESLLPVVSTFAIAQQAITNIKRNLIISLSYNLAIVVVTATLLATIGFVLNPAIGVALMVLQSSIILGINLYMKKRQGLPHMDRYHEMQKKNEKSPSSSYRRFHEHGLASKKGVENQKQPSQQGALVVVPELSMNHQENLNITPVAPGLKVGSRSMKC